MSNQLRSHKGRIKQLVATGVAKEGWYALRFDVHNTSRGPYRSKKEAEKYQKHRILKTLTRNKCEAWWNIVLYGTVMYVKK